MRFHGLFFRLPAAVLLTWWACQCASITPAPTVSFTDHRHVMVFNELEYEDEISGTKIVVPAGFVSDLASIPPSLRSYFEQGGQSYQYPAIIHDWLYWSQTTTREEADRIFDSAMKDCGVGSVKRQALWAGVRAGGEAAWNANRQDREKGLVKVIPEAHRNPRTWPRNVSWPAYRQQLFEAGVR